MPIKKNPPSVRDPRFRQLGLNIQYYRRLREMSQQELADQIGYSRAQVGLIENPNSPMGTTLENLFEIADALDIEIAKLFEFRD
jgi:transcriptional regulator with XRE-family HTH domain